MGGGVRDALLNKTTHDLDFVLTRDSQESSRKIANSLNAAYYPLDDKRKTARIIVSTPEGQRQFLDFAELRGNSIEDDLRARDFTINAMALPISQELELIDPLGGAKDLINRKLRACSINSFLDDPIRIIRAVRQAVAFQLSIVPETKDLISESNLRLPGVSRERVRDEIFRILEGPKPETAINILSVLGALDYILPEISQLRDVPQSEPHFQDVYHHSLQTVSKLNEIFHLLSPERDPENGMNWASGYLSVRLSRFRKHLIPHFAKQINPDRTHWSLTLFAALYHDSGKPIASSLSQNGKIRFLNHENVGAALIHDRTRELKLSNIEIDWLGSLVKNHMRPLYLTKEGKLPSRRAVYRFFRDCGERGVDICMISLADILAAFGPTLDKDLWISHVNTINHLLESWWEKKSEYISPEKLITGNDLMMKFDLKAGPVIGKLLSEIQEGQAIGEINDKESAYKFANGWLVENYGYISSNTG